MQDLAGTIMVVARETLAQVAQHTGDTGIEGDGVRRMAASRLAPELAASAYGIHGVELGQQGKDGLVGKFDLIGSDVLRKPVILVALIDASKGSEAIMFGLRELVEASRSYDSYRMGYACFYGAGLRSGSMRDMAFDIADTIRAELPGASITVCGHAPRAGSWHEAEFDMACVMVGKPFDSTEE